MCACSQISGPLARLSAGLEVAPNGKRRLTSALRLLLAAPIGRRGSRSLACLTSEYNNKTPRIPHSPPMCGQQLLDPKRTRSHRAPVDLCLARSLSVSYLRLSKCVCASVFCPPTSDCANENKWQAASNARKLTIARPRPGSARTADQEAQQTLLRVARASPFAQLHWPSRVCAVAARPIVLARAGRVRPNAI